MNYSTVDKLKYCFNDTCHNLQLMPSVVLLYACMAAVIILTVCGNLLVIISISHFKQLHTPTNLLILSLAMADMMVGVTVLPIRFISKGLCMHMDRILCYFYILCSYHFTFLSIYNISLISLDRLYALSNPLQYSNKVTIKLVSTVICLNWSASFGYNLAYVYINGTGTGDVSCFEECNVVANGLWASIDLFFVFILPSFIIFLSYIKIFVIAQKHAKSIRCTTRQHVAGNRKYGECAPKATERKAAITLGILVAVFLACLLPYFLTVMFSSSTPDSTVLKVLEASVLLLYLNSAINPIIYALFYPWFRKCAKLILMLRIFNPDSSLLNVLSKKRMTK